MTTIRLGADGSRFHATRHLAALFREQAIALPPDETIVLDWSGVEAITASFGDEVAGKLAAAGRDVEHAGMCDQVRETLERVRRRREDAGLAAQMAFAMERRPRADQLRWLAARLRDGGNDLTGEQK